MAKIRTEKEINAYIKKLAKNPDNFTYDNYGSEAADNGIYELEYSEYQTKETLKNFAKWMLKK